MYGSFRYLFINSVIINYILDGSFWHIRSYRLHVIIAIRIRDVHKEKSKDYITKFSVCLIFDTIIFIF